MYAVTGSSHPAESLVKSSPHSVSRLPVLILNVHNRCNCRCVMCDIWKISESRSLRQSDINEQLPAIRRLGIEWVVFSGGEPLMNDAIFRIARTLKSEGLRLTLLSTGLLLERHADEVASNFHDVIVSLDGPPTIHDQIRRVPGAFDALANGIGAIHRIAPAFPIQARTTVQVANHRALCATVECAHELGLRSISFLPVDVTSQAFNRELVWPVERQLSVALMANELSDLEKEIQTMVRDHVHDINSGFIVESPDKLQRIVAHFRAQLGLEAPVSPPCNAPWKSAVIESDGRVRPCFFHAPIGSISDGPLDAVLNTFEAVQFRAGLTVSDNTTCQRCVCSLNYQSENRGEQYAVGNR